MKKIITSLLQEELSTLMIVAFAYSVNLVRRKLTKVIKVTINIYHLHHKTRVTKTPRDKEKR